MAHMVKSPLAMEETWIQSLGQEDPLEKGIATHTNILAWRIPWTEEPGGLTFLRIAKSQTRLKQLGTYVHTQLEVHQKGSSSFPSNSSKISGITSQIVYYLSLV